MSADSVRSDWLWLLLLAALLVTMPAITLLVAFVALMATQSVILEQVTLVEAVELYVVELAAFTVFSYLLYRLTMYAIERQHRAESLETARAGEDDVDADLDIR